MNEIDLYPIKENLKILIVEDDATIAELIQGTLQSMEYTSTWMNSAEEAIRHLANIDSPEDEYDIIYLDIQLGKLDGIEFCRMCREYRHPKRKEQTIAPNSWIVAVTSLSNTTNIIDMLSSGANDYITKPITPKIIQVKTTVCRFACARDKGYRNRIQNLEKQLLNLQLSGQSTNSL